MKNSILILAVLVSLVSVSRAQQLEAQAQIQQVHPASLPEIRSQDALRIKALSVAVSGSRYVYASSMDWSFEGSVTSANTNGTYGDQILKSLFSVPFNYRVINSNDTVSGWSYIYDDCNDLLFYGYGNAIAGSLNATNKLFSTFYLESVPVLSGVKYADILVLNPDGSTAQDISLGTNACGETLMQGWLTGYSNTVLAVEFTDGSRANYPVFAPVAQVPGVTTGNDTYAVQGHYPLASSTTNGVTLQIIEIWNLPTAFLDLSVPQSVTLDVMGYVQGGSNSYFERPYSVEVTPVGGTAQTYNLNTSHASSIQLPAGKYYLKFNWNTFGQPGFLYVSSGGEKG